ncbi:cell division protein FtsL [Halobacillus sp. BBL2006]|uniref:cell division protein FtsL n=1 Tax=Halobacillus sp. BBL2006 TaxID=1543706 RepID=UPI000542CAA4|nr:cell division protein FtsL [Halobacillus sp. BBL2006]KHE70906.1 hypothetical protein LD39_10910 [Halobacillus sp. BBL2006]
MELFFIALAIVVTISLVMAVYSTRKQFHLKKQEMKLKYNQLELEKKRLELEEKKLMQMSIRNGDERI